MKWFGHLAIFGLRQIEIDSLAMNPFEKRGDLWPETLNNFDTE